jgi:hypothetical protein
MQPVSRVRERERGSESGPSWRGGHRRLFSHLVCAKFIPVRVSIDVQRKVIREDTFAANRLELPSAFRSLLHVISTTGDTT